MILTPEQIADLVCYGYPEPDWRHITAVAVILGESGGDTLAVNLVDHDPASPAFQSVDRGLCQWNDHWWPNISSYAAFTPETAWYHMHEQITLPGRWSWDFSPWNAYGNGSYMRHLSVARVAVNVVRAREGWSAL